MKTFGRLLLFAAVTCAGGFLLAELTDPAPAEGTVATTATPEATPDTASSKADTAQVAPTESAPVRVVKAHAATSDYKGGKDGKDFKDYAEPVAEGPEDAPGLLGPPIFFMNARLPGALEPAPLPPIIPISTT